MGANTKIEWAHHTFNIVWGCAKVSEACANCYAESFSNRLGLKIWGLGADRRRMSKKYWQAPLAWNREAARARRRRRVFCSSMADVLEDHPVVNEERDKLWPLIYETEWLDWLLLTKRPENFSRFLPWYESDACPRNVWLGVTAETQRWADIRIPLLLNAPAHVRFISGEPLLGSLNIRYYLRACYGKDRLDWVIAGGESGHRARPMHPAWLRDLRDQSVEAGVAFHFKQWGEWAPESAFESTPDVRSTVVFNDDEPDPTFEGAVTMYRVGKAAAGRELDGRTWDELPEAALRQAGTPAPGCGM